MTGHSNEKPFEQHQATGRKFITPCCTVSTHEYLVDATYYLVSHVAEYGWSKPWCGSLDDINETGTLVDAGGHERAVYYDASRNY